MTSIMNTNYKIKETHVSNISSFEDRKLKASLKTSPHSNKTMNNNNRTYILDPPVQHNRSRTPRMRSSTRSTAIKSSLKTATHRNNNTMNNDYRTCTLDSPVQHNRSDTPRMRSSV